MDKFIFPYNNFTNRVKNFATRINRFKEHLTRRNFVLSLSHKPTGRTDMNTINFKNYDHNIDYKFSQGASLSCGIGSKGG
jgi:hypothetical protein